MPILTPSCAAAALVPRATVAAAAMAIVNGLRRISSLPRGDARPSGFCLAHGAMPDDECRRYLTAGQVLLARGAGPPACFWRLARRWRDRAARRWRRDSASPGTRATGAARPARAWAPAPDDSAPPPPCRRRGAHRESAGGT